MLSQRPWKPEAAVALLGAWMLGMALASSVAMGIVHLIPGKPLAANRFLQFVLSTSCLHGIGLVVIQVFLIYHRVGWLELLGWRNLRWQALLRVLLTVLVVLPVVLGLNTLSASVLTKIHVQPVVQESMQVLEISITLGQKIVFGIAAIAIAPIVEESIFRGILYPTLKQSGYPRAALYASSLLFAAVHVNLMIFVPLFLLALVLVWLLETTDTLIAPILAHACFNAANFVLFFKQNEMIQWWNELIRSIRGVVGA